MFVNVNKALIVLAVVASVGVANAASDVSVGYANSRADGLNLNGLNAKYSYAPEGSNLGFISSLTLTGKEETAKQEGLKGEADYGYGSALVGVQYQINEYFTPYVMAGVGRGAVKVKISGYGEKWEDTERENGFAYSAGVKVHVTSSIFLDADYEGGKVFDTQVNTFAIGAGYSF
ncbi:Ail/Lom family outer membrane beta-barrel protein [Pseudescherichia vulneris]|uniref:Ail/Lom family outer membrane beta-barrel protein n=1 Tax=Pseudescherichia vulneris TaxID=566 RepID=UPI001EDD5C89